MTQLCASTQRTLRRLVAVCTVACLSLAACGDDSGPLSQGRDAAVDQLVPDAISDTTTAVRGMDGAESSAVADALPIDGSNDGQLDVESSDEGDGSEDAWSDAAVANDAADANERSDGTPVGDASDANDANDANDATMVDVSSAADAGDATVTDVADAADATLSDASEAADVANDAGFDDADADLCPTALRAYPARYMQAFCEGIATCCAARGAGGYDVATCESTDPAGGWDDTLPTSLDVLCGGHVTFDPDAGEACLAALRGAPCADMDAATHEAVTTSCRGVLRGTIQAGTGPCASSFECVDGTYCSGLDHSVCLGLVPDGGGCGTDDMCRSATTGQPALYCNANFDGGNRTCAPAQPNGANCVDPQDNANDMACATLQCGSDGTCGSVSSWSACPLPVLDAGID